MIVGALLVSTPFLGLLVWQAYDHAQHDTRTIEQSALDRARLAAADTRRVLDEARYLLSTLAARPLVRAADPAHCDPTFEAQVVLDAHFTNLVIVDATGREACSLAPLSPDSPASVAGQNWFREAVRSNEFTIGGPHVDPISGRWATMLALPLHDSTGRLSGVVAVEVDLGHFGPIVEETRLLPGETLVLVDGAGRILARQPDPERWVGSNIQGTEIGGLALAGGGTIATVRGEDGTKRVFGFSTIPGTDWHVYAGIPTARVLAAWQSTLFVAIVLVTIALALVIALALLAGRRIARPVHALADAAGAIAGGDLAARAQVSGFAETAVLAEWFNEMVEQRGLAEDGLRRSERNLAEAQRIAHLGSWEWDAATDTSRWSDETHRIYGIEPGTFDGSGATFLAFVHPDDRTPLQEAVRAALENGVPLSVDFRIVRPDGAVRIVHEAAEVIRDEVGSPVRMVGTVQDITERVAAEEERNRLLTAIEQAADSIWIQRLDRTIEYVNPSFTRLYGYKSEEVVGRSTAFLDSGRHAPAFWSELWASVGAGRTWSGSIVNRRRDGTLVEVEKVISALRDAHGQLTGFVQTDRDVTHERELESALTRQARERESIEAALERIDPGASPEVIAAAACAQIIRLPNVDSAFVVDLAEGDEQLLAVAGRLLETLAPGRSTPASRARYLRERARSGPWVEAWRVRPEDGGYGEQVAATGLHTVAYAPLRGVHGALGIIGLGAHDPATADELVEHLPALATFGSILGALIGPGLERRHRAADERARIQAILDVGAFMPFFQPIVDLHDGSVVGFEALSRFSGGQRPDLVFASAARVGLGVELEVATLGAALEAAARTLPRHACLNLNVSPDLVLSGSLGALIAGQDRPIILEVTEHVAVDDYDRLRRGLEALGPTVRLAVDDAGAGYASLRHVLELAPDFVKLDIGLVRGIDADPARQALIAGMGYFAVKRKVRLVAEGIETEAELETLRSLAVAYGQGYLLGRPRDSRDGGPWPMRLNVRKSDGGQD